MPNDTHLKTKLKHLFSHFDSMGIPWKQGDFEQKPQVAQKTYSNPKRLVNKV